MKERPIIFSAPMVRAILDGKKTQTRMIVKFPHQNPLGIWEPISIGGPNGGKTITGETVPEHMDMYHTRTGDGVSCPYGWPGDRLWVRESCRAEELPEGLDGVRYMSDNEFIAINDNQNAADNWCKLNNYRSKKGATVPPIHMPRWASRILLEITDVRVERLQDINPDDAISEGLKGITKDGKMVKYGIPDRDGYPGTDDFGWPWMDWRISPIDAYQRLWESINGPGSWGADPWVWVIEFKVLSVSARKETP